MFDLAGGDLDYEVRLQMPDGRVKHVRTIGQVIRHQDGRPECLASVQDITEYRFAEEALNRARSELAHVARATSLSTLTASIAHEVNQPLAGIVTNANTCVRMLSADPPNVVGALETARRTIRDGNRASEVITRLRALFSKNDTNDGDGRPERGSARSDCPHLERPSEKSRRPAERPCKRPAARSPATGSSFSR